MDFFDNFGTVYYVMFYKSSRPKSSVSEKMKLRMEYPGCKNIDNLKFKIFQKRKNLRFSYLSMNKVLIFIMIGSVCLTVTLARSKIDSKEISTQDEFDGK